ncbi:MAG: hypothetical protein QF475_03635 [Candidatus Undinarchaeales archaeon]|nr:hypothetical protein [Candidatus Undinarchaeales archaeon]
MMFSSTITLILIGVSLSIIASISWFIGLGVLGGLIVLLIFVVLGLLAGLGKLGWPKTKMLFDFFPFSILKKIIDKALAKLPDAIKSKVEGMIDEATQNAVPDGMVQTITLSVLTLPALFIGGVISGGAAGAAGFFIGLIAAVVTLAALLIIPVTGGPILGMFSEAATKFLASTEEKVVQGAEEKMSAIQDAGGTPNPAMASVAAMPGAGGAPGVPGTPPAGGPPQMNPQGVQQSGGQIQKGADQAQQTASIEQQAEDKKNKLDLNAQKLIQESESKVQDRNARIEAQYVSAMGSAETDGQRKAAKEARKEALNQIEDQHKKERKKILGDRSDMEKEEEKKAKSQEKISKGGIGGFWEKRKKTMLVLLIIFFVIIAPPLICNLMPFNSFGRAFCKADEFASEPLRRGIGAITNTIWTTIKNFVYGVIKSLMPSNPLIKDLKEQSCYPFCVDPSGKDTSWRGLEVTRLEFIPHVVYSHQQFSIVMEWENKGKTPAQFTVPIPETDDSIAGGWWELLYDLLPFLRDNEEFRPGLRLGCTEQCKFSAGIGDWLSTGDWDKDDIDLCDQICPLDTVTESTPYIVGGCAAEITYRDSDGDSCVDMYDSEPDKPNLKVDDNPWCTDGAVDVRTGYFKHRHGDIIFDAGESKDQPRDCTLEPGDILRMTWYGMNIKHSLRMDIGEEMSPDANIMVQYVYTPANDLIGTISMMSPEVQVAGSETKSIGRIANKISQSYSPTGPMMMAMGTAEDQVVSGSPFYFMVQFTNKGKGDIPGISRNQQMLYIPEEFTMRRTGSDFKDLYGKSPTGDSQWWNADSPWYPGPNFVLCKDGLPPNSENGCTNQNGSQYKIYQPKKSIHELGKNQDPLYNPMYAAVFETPYERDLKSYVFKYKVLKYMYQFEESSDLKIIGTGIAPQTAPGDQECSPQNSCGSGFICKDGNCYSEKLYTEKDPNNFRIVVYDDQGRRKDSDDNWVGKQDHIETYDANLNWVGTKNNDAVFGFTDLAVGEFDLNAAGQEIVIIDNNDNDKKTDDLEFLYKEGPAFYGVNDHKTSYKQLKAISAGDLDPEKSGDEIVVLNIGTYDSKTDKSCDILVYDHTGAFYAPSGGMTGLAETCVDAVIGKFDKGTDNGQIVALQKIDNQYQLHFIDVSSEGELSVNKEIILDDLQSDHHSVDLLDNPYSVAYPVLAAGDFDNDPSDDELFVLYRNAFKDGNAAYNDILYLYDINLDIDYFAKLSEIEVPTGIVEHNVDSHRHVVDLAAGNIYGASRGDELALLMHTYTSGTHIAGEDYISIYTQKSPWNYEEKIIKKNENKDVRKISVFDITDEQSREEFEDGKTYKSLYCCGATLPKDIDDPEGVLVEFNEWFSGKCPSYAPWYKLESECWSYAYDDRCPNTAPWDRSLTCDNGIERPITCADNRDCLLGGAICDLDAVATEGVGECRVYRCNRNKDYMHSDPYLAKTNSKIEGTDVYKCRIPYTNGDPSDEWIPLKDENDEVLTDDKGKIIESPYWVLDFEHFTGDDISVYYPYEVETQ